jgi:3(or 17)beta-hydroxysteroid dehydrogenase
MHGLNGKVVIVTGAAGTLGQAMAQRLLAECARVVATDLREGSIELPAEAMTLQHDVTDAASWDRVIAAATRQFGAVDAVVNNAGLAMLPEPQDPERVTLEHWRAVHSVNVEGVLLGCQAGIRAMKEKGGAIVNISSIAALAPSPKMAAYGASKAAVRHLTATVAAYCLQRGYPIRCNSVHPGWFLSEMTRGSRTAEELAAQERTIPMQRFGSPQEVAAAVAYLCSSESSYVTGSKVVVDGGISMQ